MARGDASRRGLPARVGKRLFYRSNVQEQTDRYEDKPTPIVTGSLLIERAAVGGNYKPGEIPVAGPETVVSSLALALLRLHRTKAPRNPGGAPVRKSGIDELTASILAKLDVLARRRKGRG